MEEIKKRRSAVFIMGRLIGLVKPLLGIMLCAIIMGVLGYLCAIFLTIVSVGSMVTYVGTQRNDQLCDVFFSNHTMTNFSWQGVVICLLCLAVLRGVLHYAEQYCNHFIAFKLLAIIRHHVFAALRKLCPARLEGRDKGNLISLITSDIELLEVFYAHTISPIVIAFLTSVVMILFIGSYHFLAGILAMLAYVTVGILLPIWNGKRGAKKGMEFRNGFGELNSFVLDSLHGLDETIQYGYGKERGRQMGERSLRMGALQKEMSKLEARQRSLVNLVIMIFSIGMLLLMVALNSRKIVGYDGVVICTVAMIGSFGPVIALANLSNTLNQTLASGERILQILEEEPVVKEVEGRQEVVYQGAECKEINFSYEGEKIFDDFSISFTPGQIVGILGPSGCGKSTLLKILMRFWDVQGGKVLISNQEISEINTKNLRNMEAYMTQETCLFHDSIANNILLGRKGISREEIMEAAQKASIHDFIMSLPNGYDTTVGELGSTLSGGERQRIGMARMFLSEAKLWLLDEPTSNLDSLNEGIILKAIEEAGKDKTIIIVSHRKSTLGIVDVIYEVGCAN